MNVKDIVRKGRLYSVLKYNNIKMDLDLMEDLELCLDCNLKELVERFGDGQNDIECIKNRISETMSLAMECIISELHDNDPKYDIIDQDCYYDTKDGVEYE